MNQAQDRYKELCDQYGWRFIKYDTKTRRVVVVEGDVIFEVLGTNFPPKSLNLRSVKCPEEKKKYLLREFNKVHNSRYTYINFEGLGAKDKVVAVCPDHGKFRQDIYLHQKGSGCSKCASELRGVGLSKPLGEYLAKYPHDYELDTSNYRNFESKIKAKCLTHGWFTKTARGLIKQGCPKCSHEKFMEQFHRKGWVHSRSNYMEMCTRSYIYLVKLELDGEVFLKVGMAQQPQHRFQSISKQSGYSLEVLHLVELDSGTVWDIENYIKTNYKQYRHKPKHWFSGHTECLSVDIYEDVKKHLPD